MIRNFDDSIEFLKEFPKIVGDKKVYKIWFSPLITVLYSALGNTAGIWIGYLLIEFIFSGIWGTWPGITSLINDGVILLISFSFLTSVLYQSTRRLRINIFNVLTCAILIFVSFIYARVIAIGIYDESLENDNLVYNVSLLSFGVSLLIFYICLVYEKYIHSSSFSIHI